MEIHTKTNLRSTQMAHTPTSKPEIGSIVRKQFCVALHAFRCLNKHLTGAPSSYTPLLVLGPAPHDPRVHKPTIRVLPRRSASATQNSVVPSENSWNSPPQKTPCYCPSWLTTTPPSLEALAQPRVCVLPAHGWTALQCGACVCMQWHACVGQTARAQAVSVPRRGREPHASGAVHVSALRETA